MFRRTFLTLTVGAFLASSLCLYNADARERARQRIRKRGRLHVVTTLPDYAVLVRTIGGERVEAESIVHSVQDPHHIRPKPSFVQMVMKADVLIATGLDLEMWLPTVVNRSGNSRVRSGEIGYVAVSQGIDLVEKPKVISQIEGDVHVFGNPHITTSPINTKQVAWNIATGLIKNDPEGKAYYEANLKKLQDELDNRLFGEELVKILGGDTLCRLAVQGKLVDFLNENKLQGKPLIDKLGGWMGKMLPLRGTPVVVYHKNWSYFLQLFGLEEAATIESKPGIPPSPRSVTNLVKMMQDDKISIILAANYFDEHKVKTVADRTGAKAVIVPLFVGGAPGMDTYFQLFDYWVNGLVEAAKETGVVSN
ncbi:MAG: zinc ABC transporter substrate-binding protein [Sedimentisphaerales bacterium]|nr:zinc ABC transporter substrate-binding protein [Sedimentisphaerales bacterium]